VRTIFKFRYPSRLARFCWGKAIEQGFLDNLAGELTLPNLVDSVKRFAIVLVLLVVATLAGVFLFDQFVATTIGLEALFTQAIKTSIVIFFGSIIIIFIRRSKYLIARHIGAQPATVFQLFMILVASILIIFALLDIFQVSPTALLIGGGVVSIVMGLVISTLVGNILAGTLVLMTHPFRVGDIVSVNNVPGRVEEISAMVTRVRNDVGGQIVIPNSAIVQGGVVVTTFPKHVASLPSRLPYSVGDRVYTTYMNAEGVVKELTAFHTKIVLDSGKELTFLNTSVITGSVAVARISQKSEKSNEALK
jgi:small-conductance mechanosensitive channel